MLILIVAQLAIVTSAPKPSAEQALAILARMDSPSNWTNRFTCGDCDGPRVTIAPYRAGDGPFGPFPHYEMPPLYFGSFYQTPVYQSAWYAGSRRVSRRIVTSQTRAGDSPQGFRRSPRRR